jgi:hypothetical protein
MIRMIKSMRKSCGGHVARIGRRGMHTEFWWESQKGKDLDVGARIILKWVLEKHDGVGFICLRIGTSGKLLYTQ